MSEQSERIEDAAESIAESDERAAAASERVADAVVHTEIAQAAEIVTAAAGAAVALANTTAAQAELDAAQMVQSTEEQIAWLRQHATQTDTSLNEIRSLTSETSSSIASQLSAMQQALSSLTRPHLVESEETGAPGIQVVTPLTESAGAEDPANPNPSEPSLDASQNKKRQMVWI